MRRSRHTWLRITLVFVFALVVTACGVQRPSSTTLPPSETPPIASTWTPVAAIRVPSGYGDRTPTSQPSRPVVSKISWTETVRRCIVHRESRGLYHVVNPSSGASGGYQFLDRTFHAVTGLPGKASDYPKKVQDRAFYKLFANGKGRHHWYLKGGPQCW